MTPPSSVTPRTSMDAGVPSVPDAGRTRSGSPDGGRTTGGMDAGVPPPPPASTPRTLAYSLAEMGAAFQERQRLLNDRALLGQNYETWAAARSSTYANMSLAILRIQYYLQRSQTDLNSIRVPLEAWVRESRTSTDPVIRDTLTRLLENLRALRETYNIERAGILIGMIEELQQPPLAPRTPDAGAVPPPRPSSPPSDRPRRDRRDAGPPPSRPDAGTTPPTAPDAGSPPPARPETEAPPPPPSRGGADAGVPPPPPPRSRRPILPPPDAGVR